MKIINTSKELDINEFEDKNLDNNDSPSYCERNIKVIFIIILVILSSIIIALIIFLFWYFNRHKECSEGYFREKNNSNNNKCIKCSIENCKTCEGYINNNTCISCISPYKPNYDKNKKIISCELEEKKEINKTNIIDSDLIEENKASDILQSNSILNEITTNLLNEKLTEEINYGIKSNQLFDDLSESNLNYKTDMNIINDSNVIDKISESKKIGKSIIISNTIINEKTDIILDTQINQEINNEFTNGKITDNSNESYLNKIKETIVDSNIELKEDIITENIIICEPGYFMPNNSNSCEKCSLDNCQICHGLKNDNICTSCFPRFIPSYINNFIISCDYCELGDKDKCSECDINNFECSRCNSGFSLSEGKCISEYSFEAVYETKSNYEYIQLINSGFQRYISKMKIDGNEVSPRSGITLNQEGNHSLNFKMENMTNFDDMFNNVNNLISIYFYNNFNTENITSMSNIFRNCTSLKSIHISNFNTKKVDDMDEMFYNCYSLTSLNLSSFNTKNVNYMSLVFFNCTTLNYLDISSFNINRYNYLDVTDIFKDINRNVTIYLNSNFLGALRQRINLTGLHLKIS